MAFNWQEYLTLARHLQGQTVPEVTREGVVRALISRAYYAAFGHARNYARDWLGFVPRYSGEDHGRVREHLKRRRRWAVGTFLEELRQSRNECDYLDVLSEADLDRLVNDCLAAADYIIRALPPPASP